MSSLYTIISSSQEKPKRKRLRRLADIDNESDKSSDVDVEVEVIVIDADDDEPEDTTEVKEDDDGNGDEDGDDDDEEEEGEEEEEPIIINIDSDDDEEEEEEEEGESQGDASVEDLDEFGELLEDGAGRQARMTEDDLEEEYVTEELDHFPGEPRSFIDSSSAHTISSSSSSSSSGPTYVVTVDGFPDAHLPFYAPPKLLSHPMIMGQVHVNYNSQFNGTCSQVRRVPITTSSSSSSSFSSSSSSSSTAPLLYKVTGTKGSGASSQADLAKLDRARSDAFSKRKRERISSNIQTGMKKPTKKQLSSARAAAKTADRTRKEGGGGAGGGAGGGGGGFKTAAGKVLKPIQAPTTTAPSMFQAVATFPPPHFPMVNKSAAVPVAVKKPAVIPSSGFRQLVFAPPPPPFKR